MNSVTSVLTGRSTCLRNTSLAAYAASVWDTAVTVIVPLTTGRRSVLCYKFLLSFSTKIIVTACKCF